MTPQARHPTCLPQHHFGPIRLASFLLCSAPAMWLGWEWLSDSLGVNPLNRLLHFSGRWALILLTLTMTATPARRLSVFISQAVQASYGRRLSDWRWLIQLRRQWGLFTFFYATLHFGIYVWFDAGPDMAAVLEDARLRPFIAIGLVAFMLLIPLAATSNKPAMKLLGGAWRKLHTLTYLIAVLALTHFWIQAKVGDLSPLPYSLFLGTLLVFRFIAWLSRHRPAAHTPRNRRRDASKPTQDRSP